MATRYNTTPTTKMLKEMKRDWNTPMPKLKLKKCKKVLELAKQFKFYPKGIKYWLQLYESNYMKELDCGVCNCPFEDKECMMQIIYMKKIKSFFLTTLTDKKLFISFMLIHSKFRRRGFGEHFIKQMQKRNRSIILSTLNPSMIALCHKLNFICSGYMRDDPDDPNRELKFVWDRESDE